MGPWRRTLVVLHAAVLPAALADSVHWCRPRMEHDCHGAPHRLVSTPEWVLGFEVGGAYPVWVDVDRDGDLDIVTLGSSKNQSTLDYFERVNETHVEQKSGDANPFRSIDIFAVPGAAHKLGLAIADWDGDGHLDAVVGNELGLYLWLQQERAGHNGPTFELQAEPLSVGGFSPALVDWDGDGRTDLVMVVQRGDFYRIELWLQGANASLALQSGSGVDPFWGLSRSPCSIQLADFDGDNDLDVLLMSDDTAELVLLERITSNTIMQTGVPLLQDLGLCRNDAEFAINAGDWNEDGLPDVLIGFGGNFWAQEPGYTSFTPRVDVGDTPFVEVFSSGSALVFADVNGDSALDAVAADSNHRLVLFEQSSPDTLVKQKDAPMNPFEKISKGSDGFSLPWALVDWNGDGRPDCANGRVKLQGGVYVWELEYWELEDGFEYKLRDEPGHSPVWDLVQPQTDDSLTNAYEFSTFNHMAFVNLSDDNYTDLVMAGRGLGLLYWRHSGENKTCCLVPAPPPWFGVPDDVNSFSFIDWNGDGALDLVTVQVPLMFVGGGTQLPLISVYLQDSSGLFVRLLFGPDSDPFVEAVRPGDYFVSFVDWDGDGDDDMVATNVDTVVTYYARDFCHQRSRCHARGQCGVDGRCKCIDGHARGDCFLCAPGGVNPNALRIDYPPRCEKCLPGTFHNIHTHGCQDCPFGEYAPEHGATACSLCPAGSVPAPGRDRCEACGYSAYARQGDDTCEPCALGYHTDAMGMEACVLDIRYLITLCACLVTQFVATFLVAFHIRRKIRITDVSQLGASVVVTSFFWHGVWVPRGTTTVVLVEGTGSFALDNRLFRARILDAVRLELLDEHEQPPTVIGPDASIGTLTQPFPKDLLHRGFFLPVAHIAAILLPIAWIVYICGEAARVFDRRSQPTLLRLLLVLGNFGAMGLAAACALFARWLFSEGKTPIEYRRKQFAKRLAEPQQCERGPGRAISVNKLMELLNFFRDFIGQRTAYYMAANIIIPLTSKGEVSYAELVGPQRLDFFVSHYWGTPFAHFVDTIYQHATKVTEDWGSLGYWICFLSNNQWRVSAEVGDGEWRESSFYKALRSGLCRATVMVLDSKALPLTRSWCLFEVLQTYRLQHEEGSSFGGLIFCASEGLIGGGSCFDIDVALARRLVSLSVADASASNKDDQDMIDSLVGQEGGPAMINEFIRHNMQIDLHKSRDKFNNEMEALSAQLSGTPHLGTKFTQASDVDDSHKVHTSGEEPNTEVEALDRTASSYDSDGALDCL